jgi:CheY-like chemotaxis protein
MKIQLVHWDAADRRDKARKLKSAGYRVVTDLPAGGGALRKLSESRLAAVVIDLGRAPSQGRDVALAIRSYKASSHLPLVFVEGDPEKVARIKEILPDCVYTTWSRIRSALKQAITHPPKDPVKPSSVFAGYSGTPLPKKLGIKAGSTVALAGAPRGFEKTLGELPEGVTLRKQARGRRDLTLWFTKSRKDLDDRIKKFAAEVGDGGLWIIWPKQASGLSTDLTQNIVRQMGLASGLVDYKICAVDETWSGLKFSRRKSK